ncbi:MAG: C_GCAxxG_C_C family protein [Firmicutes bacterium]|nr:C_GCAxxG_C_C family protein [Bacillota bacterium]
MLTQDEIREQFMQRYHCSQVVIREWAEELGLDKDQASQLAAPLGGGMFRGDTCGAVAGAMLVIGARYGHFQPNDVENDQISQQKVKEFQDAFTARFGTTICRELLHYDFSQPGEMMKAAQAGVMMKQCPGYVEAALEILDDIM